MRERDAWDERGRLRAAVVSVRAPVTAGRRGTRPCVSPFRNAYFLLRAAILGLSLLSHTEWQKVGGWRHVRLKRAA